MTKWLGTAAVLALTDSRSSYSRDIAGCLRRWCSTHSHLRASFQYPAIRHAEAGRDRFLHDAAVQIHLLRQITRIEP